MPKKHDKTILILGGTTEAVQLADDLASTPQIRVITSLAGRTKKPAVIKGEVRIGGFGGVINMVAYFDGENIDEVVDATHPFATKITTNAKLACKLAGIPLKRITRPAWRPTLQDDWQSVDSLKAAALALPKNSNVFLALGSQHLDIFLARDDVHFTIRMVDPPGIPLKFKQSTFVMGLPGKTVEAEKSLFETHNITHLVCRNSGGKRGLSKLAAARELGIKIIMIERPESQENTPQIAGAVDR